MTVDYTFKVRKRTINKLDIITVEHFMNLMLLGKCLPSKLKNFLTIFVETLKLYGG